MEARPAFVARAVRDAAEAAAWGELCGRGFSHRPGDPKRFYRKLLADPSCPLAGVRVTVAPTGEFVGSVRVPERVIDVDGAPVRAAGIAEVCSDPAFRGQGIASVALPDAMAYCDASSGCAFSLLHAAPAVSGLYAKYGYAPLAVPYSRAPVDVAAGAPLPPSAVVRPADLASEAEAAALDGLHAATHAALGVTGFTYRPPAYWARWLPVVAGGGYHVLQLADEVGAVDGGGGGDGPPPIAAFVCVMNKGGLRVFDFGARAGLPRETAAAFVMHVAAATVAAEGPAASAGGPPAAAPSLLIPTRLAEGLLPPGLAHADDDAADRGWMVRPLPGGPGGAPGGQAACDALMRASAEGRFIVWVADSF